jgi:hypothetical protein
MFVRELRLAHGPMELDARLRGLLPGSLKRVHASRHALLHGPLDTLPHTSLHARPHGPMDALPHAPPLDAHPREPPHALALGSPHA